MKWTKKHTMITLFIVFILTFSIIFYNTVIKKSAKPKPGNMTFDDIFKEVLKQYGYETAKLTEQVIRFESGHFKSSLCKRSNNYGNIMPAYFNSIYNLVYPYGWASLSGWWNDNPELAPSGYVKEASNGYYYLKFKTPFAGIMSVAKILHLRGNDPGLYYGEDQPEPYDANWYRDQVAKIETQFIL